MHQAFSGQGHSKKKNIHFRISYGHQVTLGFDFLLSGSSTVWGLVRLRLLLVAGVWGFRFCCAACVVMPWRTATYPCL